MNTRRYGKYLGAQITGIEGIEASEIRRRTKPNQTIRESLSIWWDKNTGTSIKKHIERIMVKSGERLLKESSRTSRLKRRTNEEVRDITQALKHMFQRTENEVLNYSASSWEWIIVDDLEECPSGCLHVRKTEDSPEDPGMKECYRQ